MYGRSKGSRARPTRGSMRSFRKWRTSSRTRPPVDGLHDVAEEDLEVLAFGEAGGEEVVGGGAAAFEDADLAAGLLGAGGDDSFERLGVDVLRARAGHQDRSRRGRLQGQRVQPLVALARGL